MNSRKKLASVAGLHYGSSVLIELFNNEALTLDFSENTNKKLREGHFFFSFF